MAVHGFACTRRFPHVLSLINNILLNNYVSGVDKNKYSTDVISAIQGSQHIVYSYI